MWQISDTRWLNPLAIASVCDYRDQDFLMVMYIGGTLHDGANQERFTGDDRQAVLDFLARTSTRYIYPAPASNDEPPF